MRGHIRQRGDGRWAIVIEMDRDEGGKRRQKWHAVQGGRRDAERELARLLHERNTGVYAEPSRLTVGDYLKRWLEDSARPRISARSYDHYESLIRIHLAPRLGGMRLDRLTPLAIQHCYSEAGRVLCANTVRTLSTILRQALAQAVRWRLLAVNPAAAVPPPRAHSPEMIAFTEEQIGKLLTEARGTRLYIPLLLAVSTGMRRNEILALRWADVDLDAGRLSVRQNLEKSKSGVAFKAPKTAKGRRPIDLSPSVVAALRRHYGEQARMRRLLGARYQNHDLVVCRPDGTPDTPSVISRMFRDVARRLALPSLRFHDLRHTHATLLFRQGEHPKVVSERLGHSGIAITLDRYSHILPDMQRAAADRLDAAMRRALGE